MLPLEDKHHMPPEQKQQLSSAEIALLKSWIEDGASFDKIVGELQRVFENNRLSKFNPVTIFGTSDYSSPERFGS